MNTRPAPLNGFAKSTYTVHSETLKALNKKLSDGFHQHCNDKDVKKTHLFNGRYENIYLNSQHIPELDTLLKIACDYAAEILQVDDLQAGCWFNDMPPGAVTTAHSHDDYDELLSAAYYVTVPDNSGNLVIHDAGKKIEIAPEEGMFVFFGPEVVHEVTENLSNEHRISVGINFGKKASG